MVELSLKPYPGRLCLATTRKDFEKSSQKVIGRRVPAEALLANDGRLLIRTESKTKFKTYLVWVNTRNAVVHEAAHVVLDVFEDVGIVPNEGNGEPFAYMLGYVVEQIESHWEKGKRKKKR